MWPARLFFLVIKGKLMPILKNYFLKIIFLLTLIFPLVSCGGTKDALKPAGNDKTIENSQVYSLQSKPVENNQDESSQRRVLKSKSSVVSVKSTTIPKKSSIELYKKARQAYIDENYSYAAILFSKFIKKYPKDPLTDNATYWLGECHYSNENYNKAILIFKDLVRKYPKSEKVADATLKTGYSYLSLYDLNRSYHFLKLVINKYPFSSAAQKARVKILDFE